MKYGAIMAMLAVAAMWCATAAAVETEYPIWSWETDPDIFQYPAGHYYVSSDGVTDGNRAVAVEFPSGWNQGIRRAEGATGSEPFFPALAGATKLRLDVTSSRDMFNNPGGSGTIQMALFMQGQPGGGVAFNQTYDYLLVTPAYSPTLTTETLEWDLTMGGTVDPLPEFNESTGGWFDFRIHFNTSSGVFGSGWVVLDSLRSVKGNELTGLCDFSGNGRVGQEDYTQWADWWNPNIPFVPPAPGSVPAYLLDDPEFYRNTALYTMWADNFGNVYYTNPTIPEPATLAMLALGTAGLLRRRRT